MLGERNGRACLSPLVVRTFRIHDLWRGPDPCDSKRLVDRERFPERNRIKSSCQSQGEKGTCPCVGFPVEWQWKYQHFRSVRLPGVGVWNPPVIAR